MLLKNKKYIKLKVLAELQGIYTNNSPPSRASFLEDALWIIQAYKREGWIGPVECGCLVVYLSFVLDERVQKQFHVTDSLDCVKGFCTKIHS